MRIGRHEPRLPASAANAGGGLPARHRHVPAVREDHRGPVRPTSLDSNHVTHGHAGLSTCTQSGAHSATTSKRALTPRASARRRFAHAPVPIRRCLIALESPPPRHGPRDLAIVQRHQHVICGALVSLTCCAGDPHSAHKVQVCEHAVLMDEVADALCRRPRRASATTSRSSAPSCPRWR
jgi:hypothetical protein